MSGHKRDGQNVGQVALMHDGRVGLAETINP